MYATGQWPKTNLQTLSELFKMARRLTETNALATMVTWPEPGKGSLRWTGQKGQGKAAN